MCGKLFISFIFKFKLILNKFFIYFYIKLNFLIHEINPKIDFVSIAIFLIVNNVETIHNVVNVLILII